MHVGLRKHRATYHGPWLLPGVPRAEPLVVLANHKGPKRYHHQLEFGG
jgi:hypothetical protein